MLHYSIQISFTWFIISNFICFIHFFAYQLWNLPSSPENKHLLPGKSAPFKATNFRSRYLQFRSFAIFFLKFWKLIIKPAWLYVLQMHTRWRWIGDQERILKTNPNKRKITFYDLETIWNNGGSWDW